MASVVPTIHKAGRAVRFVHNLTGLFPRPCTSCLLRCGLRLPQGVAYPGRPSLRGIYPEQARPQVPLRPGGQA